MKLGFRFAILIFLVSHSVNTQLASNSSPIEGFARVSRLVDPDMEVDAIKYADADKYLFGVCYPTSAPYQRHLCRSSKVSGCCLPGYIYINMTDVSPAPINNFAV